MLEANPDLSNQCADKPYPNGIYDNFIEDKWITQIANQKDTIDPIYLIKGTHYGKQNAIHHAPLHI